MAFNPVWANSIEIDTTGSGGYSKLCKGIESMTFAQFGIYRHGRGCFAG